MTQIAFGVTQGPNGPQMTAMFIPTSGPPAQPTSYESHLETPEGVHVKLTYHTSNKAMADRYSDEIAQKSGWKVLEQEPEQPETLGSKIISAWVAAFLLPLMVSLVAFMLAMTLRVADYIGFNDVSDVVSISARYGLWAFPILGFVFSGMALFTLVYKNTQLSAQIRLLCE